ncbi:methyltransferase domain-containing protein [Xylophilus sp. Kf1]|nr:methyltransferase domain-containing protein [Xylophilus sp. Kf1]
MYSASDDPYSVKTRWYEQRKRALLMAALPQQRYRRAYEPGCGVGELTLGLAARCDEVLAADFSEQAVQVARQRTAALPHVQVERQTLPTDWPREAPPFDLIVLSEVAYFLDEEQVRQVAQRCSRSLVRHGTLVACDWRPDFQERASSTAAVQSAWASLGLHRIVLHEETDFLLQVWCGDERSVAQHEGIR